MSSRSPSASLTHARDTFCQYHWPRLLHLARQRGCDPQTAQDVVQDLFLSLLRRGVLDALAVESPSAQAGYLATNLRCLLINRWRDAHRQRRGGQTSTVSLDDEEVPEPACGETPATHYDRAWLSGCIRQAMVRLEKQTSSQVWQQLQPALEDDPADIKTSARRTALHRARKRLRLLVREEMNGSFQDWSESLLPRWTRQQTSS